MQVHDDEEYPVGYFSRCLDKSEVNYPTYDLELLATVASILYFKDLLENKPFTVIVDNLALSFFMNRDDLTGQLARAVMLLSRYAITIKHVKSSSNFFADFLSRHPPNKRLFHPKFEPCDPRENSESGQKEVKVVNAISTIVDL